MGLCQVRTPLLFGFAVQTLFAAVTRATVRPSMAVPGRFKSLYADFGARVRRLRTEAGLNQQTVGEMVGLSRTSITNIERGRQPASLHLLVLLAKALKVPVTALLPAVEPLEGVPAEREKVLKSLKPSTRSLVGQALERATAEREGDPDDSS